MPTSKHCLTKICSALYSSAIETATCLVRVHLDLAFCWRWISWTSTSGYCFGYFFKQAFQSRQGRRTYRKKETARFWMSNSPIKALTLWILATFWTRSPSKIKSLRTFNTRSRHAFPIAILVLLLPKSSITKQVCSNSTFKVFSHDPPPWNCSDSKIFYAPCGHIVTGDLKIVRNIKLRDLLSKGPKYREPVSYSWHQNFGIINGCMWRVCQTVGKERRRWSWHSFWVDQVDRKRSKTQNSTT